MVEAPVTGAFFIWTAIRGVVCTFKKENVTIEVDV